MTPVVEKLGAEVDRWVADNDAQLVATRRHLHAHPELAFAEFATTAYLEHRLREAGLTPRRLPAGTGLVVRRRVRRSRSSCCGPTSTRCRSPTSRTCPTPPRARGCATPAGTTSTRRSLLGVALALGALDGLPGTVRLVFQPAEEIIPGGASEVVAAGVLEGASRAFALHCDPAVPVGTIGLRTGAITAACDRIDVTLTGPGGHTARPQLTVDLVDALGRLITDVPALLSRQVDPRSGMSLVWGAVNAGVAANAIPQRGNLRGTVRVLDRDAWKDAEELMRSLVERVAATTGAGCDVDYVRGLPPVVNDPRAVGAHAGRGAGDRDQRPRRPDAAEHGRRGLRLVRRGRADRAGPARHARGRAAAGPAPGHLRRRRAGDRDRRPADGAHGAARAGGRAVAPATGSAPPARTRRPAPGDTSARRAVDERREPDDEFHRPAG